MIKDSQILKVYKAEIDTGLHKKYQFQSLNEIKEFVSFIRFSLFSKKWNNFYNFGVEVDISNEEGISRGMWGKIKLAPFCYNKLFVLHELSHAICCMEWGWDGQPHGQKFCETYLELVKNFYGENEYIELKDSFIKNDVQFEILKSTCHKLTNLIHKV